MSVNKVIILGNLGQDPTVRYSPSGSAVTNISIACSERWKDKQTGEQKESTEWVRAVAFNKPAEIIGDHFKKGQQIYIEGKLRTRSYDKDGVKQYTTEVMIDEFQFVGNRPSADAPSQPRQSTQQRPSQGAAPSYADDYDSDIPFMDMPKLLAKHHLI